MYVFNVVFVFNINFELYYSLMLVFNVVFLHMDEGTLILLGWLLEAELT